MVRLSNIDIDNMLTKYIPNFVEIVEEFSEASQFFYLDYCQHKQSLGQKTVKI